MNIITLNNVHSKGIFTSSKINKLIHFVHAFDGYSRSLSLNNNEFAIISMTWYIGSINDFTYLIPHKDRILLCLENNQDVENAIKFNIPFILCPMSVFIDTSIFNLQNSDKIYKYISKDKIGNLIGTLQKSKTAKKVKSPAKKPNSPAKKSGGACYRCGRTSHWSPDCYATTHVDGYELSENEDSEDDDEEDSD